MYAIIIGGGKVGYYLVKDLLAKGHEVTVIEREEAKCRRLSEEFGTIALEGSAAALRAEWLAERQRGDWEGPEGPQVEIPTMGEAMSRLFVGGLFGRKKDTKG